MPCCVHCIQLLKIKIGMNNGVITVTSRNRNRTDIEITSVIEYQLNLTTSNLKMSVQLHIVTKNIIRIEITNSSSTIRETQILTRKERHCTWSRCNLLVHKQILVLWEPKNRRLKWTRWILSHLEPGLMELGDLIITTHCFDDPSLNWIPVTRERRGLSINVLHF